ncbi:autotransporter domain-containing protein [Microvirga sp. 17 mud 1-3]|uniref:autotransporter outer membrane beta-barrel domain-containing protein n=1 Tax=Microvirga sp. 17 mud 1-3 TaxID=2082949 RepID=UPI0013A58049|nr:autotransporter domain-containing protein [Microvirga sp. 17 mud 1-3]
MPGSYWQDSSNWNMLPSSSDLAVIDNGDVVYVDGSQGFADAGILRIGSTFGAVGGTVSIVNGGSLSLGSGATSGIGYETGTIGNVIVEGFSSRWNGSSSNLTVGYRGEGNVIVRNLGTMSVSNLYIGDLSGNGTVTVSSGGTLNVFQGTHLGRGFGSSDAILNVYSGGGAFLNSLSTGLFAPSTVNVSGPGSWLSVASTFALGEGSAGGTLNLGDDGKITVGNGSGTITIGGGGAGWGIFSVGGAAGSPAVAPGTIQAAAVNLSAGSLLNFNHTASAYVFSPQITGSGQVHVNSGTTVLERANTYSGGTVVNFGALIANASGALGSGAVSLNSDTASLTYGGAGVSAGPAAITLNNSSKVTFSNGASAGSASITIANDPSPSLGMGLFLTENSTAGNATITNVFGGGYQTVTFRGTSTAGSASITNGSGAVTAFENNSSAGAASITNNGGSTFLQNNATGGTATFVNTNGSLEVSGSSNLESATVTNGAMGRTYIYGNASGGKARIVNNSTGFLDISGLSSAGTTLGSIEGAGEVRLGSKNLTVGSNNLSTTVSGLISGLGALTKVGTGTLTLTGVNSYAGGTTISQGTLEIQSAAALGSLGRSPVILNGGQLRSNITSLDVLLNPVRFADSSVISVAPGQTFNINLAEVDAGVTLRFGTASDTGTLVPVGINLATAGSTTVEVNGGTLRAGGPQLPKLLAAADRTTIADGATLDLSTLGATIRNLRGAGTLMGRDDTVQIMSGDFAGRITGDVALYKISSDSLKLDGASTLTGPTYVQAGQLAVNGSLASSPVTVTGGTLSGTGTVGRLSLQSGGTVAPGNSIGTLNVAGPLSFGPGAFYAVEIDGAGRSDRIAVTGTATLNGGTVQILPDQGINFLADHAYTILTAQGGRTGTFAGTQSTDFAFITPTLGYTADAVTLTMVRKTVPPTPPAPPPPVPPAPPVPMAFHTVAVTENQYHTADAVEALGAGNRLYNTVLGSTVAGARQAFDALSGEAHGSAVTAGYAQAGLIQTTLLTRLRQPLTSLPLLAQGAYGAAFAADRPGQAVMPVAVTPAPIAPRYALWGEGFGAWGKTRSDRNAASLDTSTGGFLIGADAQVTDGWRLGLAGGYLRTSFDVDARLSSGSNESIFGALYGSGQWGALTLRLGAAYARHDIDLSRTITFPGYADAVKASYDGSTLQAFGELGYRLGFGALALEPFVGASVLRLSTDGFQEQGGAAALTGYGRTYDLGTTTVGLRAEARLSETVPLTLSGLLGWRHAYGDVAPEALLAFAGGASPFTVAGVPVDRDALVAEAGLDWRASEAISLGVSYAGQIGARAQEHTVKGNFVWRFGTY